MNKYPWLVRIFAQDLTHYCGGTLIASKYVISAAHCFFVTDEDYIITSERTAEETAILIGAHNLNTGETNLPLKFVNVKTIINHPEYDQQIGQEHVIGDGFDITILELEEEVDLEVYTPACLAESSDDTAFDNKTATAAGWGYLVNGGPYPDQIVPHEVDLPVLAAADCRHSKNHPSLICAGFEEGGKDSCSVSGTYIMSSHE